MLVESYKNSESSTKFFDFPILPEPIHEIIKLSFQKSGEKEKSSELDRYINTKKDFLVRILGLAPFNFVKEHCTIEQSIIQADLKTLRNLLLVDWIKEFLISQNENKFDNAPMFKQKILSAFFALYLARQISQNDSEDIFLQAFLQELSVLIYPRRFQEDYGSLTNLRSKKDFSAVAQTKIIDAEQSQLSEKILKKWDFPEEFIQPLIINYLETD